MKNGSLELLKKLFKDGVIGTLLVLLVAVPAILIKVAVKYYEKFEGSDPIIINGLYTLAYIFFAIDFVVAVAIAARLAWELIKETWR